MPSTTTSSGPPSGSISATTRLASCPAPSTTRATRSRAPPTATRTSSPTSHRTPASTTKAALTIWPRRGKVFPLLRLPPHLQAQHQSRASMSLTPTTPVLPSPTDRAGVTAATILQRTPSCHRRRLSLALGRRHHRPPASTARLPLPQLVTSLMGARTRLPRPDALSSVLERRLPSPGIKDQKTIL